MKWPVILFFEQEPRLLLRGIYQLYDNNYYGNVNVLRGSEVKKNKDFEFCTGTIVIVIKIDIMIFLLVMETCSADPEVVRRLRQPTGSGSGSQMPLSP